MNIKTHLKKYGYHLELSKDLDLYERKLIKYLSEERYENICKLREDMQDGVLEYRVSPEEPMEQFIGEDVKLYKIILSSQITASIAILKVIESLFRKSTMKVKNILDLGGADGWAADYLSKTFKWNSKITVVDKYKYWKSNEKSIQIIHEDYGHFKVSNKFDLIISIFGTSPFLLENFLKCIKRSLSPEGMAFVSLRISDENDFRLFQDELIKNNLDFHPSYFGIAKNNHEQFKVFCLKHSVESRLLSANERLYNFRKFWQQIEESKRLVGQEAEILKELIKDGDQISKDTENWDNGDWFKLEIIKKNEIYYRLCSNNRAELVVEYPVIDFDVEHALFDQIDRIHNDPSFWNAN